MKSYEKVTIQSVACLLLKFNSNLKLKSKFKAFSKGLTHFKAG
jgi:hypothetical protein